MLGIIGQKHIDRVLCVVHAAGGVDARRDLKSHLARAGGTAVEQPGKFQNRAQSGILGLVQILEAVLDDHAVFPDQRHHVCHGRDGHQLQERLQYARQLVGRPSERREQRLHQLERNARAAQVFVGIRAVAAVGVEHGERGRKLGLGQMMIGDDDVDAAFARGLNNG